MLKRLQLSTQKSLRSNQSNKAFYDEHDERGGVVALNHNGQKSTKYKTL